MDNLKQLLLSDDMDKDVEIVSDGIEVLADSLNEALEIGARELGLSIDKLDYEILERGRKGFLWVGRKPYRVLVLPIKQEVVYKQLGREDGELEESVMESSDSLPKESFTDLPQDEDGKAKIKILRNGIWLIVYPPRGNGKPIDFREVEKLIYMHQVKSPDMKKVRMAVDNPSGEPVKIGDWEPNPYDSKIMVNVTPDKMKAIVTITSPKGPGRHLDFDDVISALKQFGVKMGIKKDKIREVLDKELYQGHQVLAEGKLPRRGRDAYIDYKVNVRKHKSKVKELEDGRVDFKDLDLIENVVVDQVLAVKVPAEKGEDGYTVAGDILPSKSGKDIELKPGKGTILSEDGMTLKAEINGHVVYRRGRIHIEPVYLIKGDVGPETGDITFIGSVVVNGSVLDNFKVKAAGNVVVYGTVQKSQIEAEGDIIIRGGVSGKDEGKVVSMSGSVFAKFLQNAIIKSGEDVVSQEGILHCKVGAGTKVICYGRKAQIVGGIVRATDEVNAKAIGSSAYARTKIEVGIYPEVREKLEELENKKKTLHKEITESIEPILGTIGNQVNLKPDKLEKINKAKQRREEIDIELKEIEEETSELNEYVKEASEPGKISVKEIIYPGVELLIKDVFFEIRDEYKKITITQEAGKIKFLPYEPIKFDTQTVRKRIGKYLR